MGTIAWAGNVSSVYWDGPIGSIYQGSEMLWEAKKKETITLQNDGSVFGRRDQFRAALTDYGLDYRTVTELPFNLDTSQVTNMNNMFRDCSALTRVPEMDTRQVTSMDSMFFGCSSLMSVPDMDTSQVTNMFYMFGNCEALMSVPDMDTSQVTNMLGTFAMCSSLTDGNVRLIGKHPDVNTTSMISRSGLTREPFYNTNGNPI